MGEITDVELSILWRACGWIVPVGVSPDAPAAERMLQGVLEALDAGLPVRVPSTEDLALLLSSRDARVRQAAIRIAGRGSQSAP